MQKIDYSALIKETFEAHNAIRTSPTSFIPDLERTLKLFKGDVIHKPGEIPLRTNEGQSALIECIEFLRSAKTLPALVWNDDMAKAAQDHAEDIGPQSIEGHDGSNGSTMSSRLETYGDWDGTIGENIDFGSKTGREVVCSLIVDDGNPGRGHRKNIFNPKFKFCGVGAQRHGAHKTCIVIDYAGGFCKKGAKPQGGGYGPIFGAGLGPGFGAGHGPGFGAGPGPKFGAGPEPGFGPGPGPKFGAGPGPGFGAGPGPGFGGEPTMNRHWTVGGAPPQINYGGYGAPQQAGYGLQNQQPKFGGAAPGKVNDFSDVKGLLQDRFKDIPEVQTAFGNDDNPVKYTYTYKTTGQQPVVTTNYSNNFDDGFQKDFANKNFNMDSLGKQNQIDFGNYGFGKSNQPAGFSQDNDKPDDAVQTRVTRNITITNGKKVIVEKKTYTLKDGSTKVVENQVLE